MKAVWLLLTCISIFNTYAQPIEVTLDAIETLNDVVYWQASSEPFTGKVVSFFW